MDQGDREEEPHDVPDLPFLPIEGSQGLRVDLRELREAFSAVRALLVAGGGALPLVSGVQSRRALRAHQRMVQDVEAVPSWVRAPVRARAGIPPRHRQGAITLTCRLQSR